MSITVLMRGIAELKPAPPEYEQIINYTMLYDEGDECADVTGGWTSSGYSASGKTITAGIKNTNNIYLHGATSIYNLLGTDAAVSVNDYSLCGCIVTVSGTFATINIEFQMERYKNLDTDRNNQIDIDWNTSADNGLKLADLSTRTGSYYAIVMSTNQTTRSGYVHNVFLAKPDDWQTLCQKTGITAPADLATLLADTTSLTAIFNSEDAVNFMTKQCTGDFMVGVLNNADAVALLKASPYLNTIIGNPHWAKFMMMIPTANGMLSRLPIEYQEVEYLQGDGAGAYINTGLTTANNWRALLDLEFTDTNRQRITGSNASGGEQFIYFETGKFAGYLGGTKFETSAFGIGRYLIDFIAFSTGSSVLIDNVKVATGGTNFIRTKNILLFTHTQGANQNPETTSYGYFKLYGGKYYQGTVDTLVRDYVPCYRKSDNLAGLYDLVNNVFYTNAGSGAFSNGDDVFRTETDNWATWASLGGVTATDIATLLADSAKMATLMSNEKAVEYLAGCTGDLMVSICNSETAMSALVNNIAYDTLFNHPVWYKFMTMCPVSLAAMDSVAVTVPTMTSNTTPSGVASASRTTTNKPPYLAFDNDGSSVVYNDSSTMPWYVQYSFEEVIDVFKLYAVLSNYTGSSTCTSTHQLQVSEDGETFDTVYQNTATIPAGSGKAINLEVILDKPVRCKVIRFNVTSATAGSYNYPPQVNVLQAYGKAVV